MKKSGFIIAVLLLVAALAPTSGFAKDYHYMSAAEVKENLGNNTPMTLVDIQVEKEFKQHHIIDAVATYAYPVKSTADRDKMAVAVAALQHNSNLAVVVCPRGGGGAKRAYDHLVNSGIAEERVYILTAGQAQWPYPELLAPAE